MVVTSFFGILVAGAEQGKIKVTSVLSGTVVSRAGKHKGSR